MPQIIPARSFSSQLGLNLGQSISGGYAEKLQAKEQQKLAETKFKQEKELIELKESVKLKGKEDLFNKQIELLKGSRKGNKEQGNESLQSESSNGQLKGMQDDTYTDEQIEIANLINPALGRDLREQKKSKEKQDIAQKKEISGSFGGENGKYITKIHDQFEDSMRKEAIFDRMEQLENSGKLSDSGAINFLEQIGFRPEWLKNPENEEYNKLSLDLLGGGTLQSDYGSRVLASEFKVSQQRIPTLSQTPEGRRQIRENLQTMLLPAKLKEERMQYYIDKAERTGEPLPHDLRGKILKDIKPQLEEAYDKFKQRNGRYKVKTGTPLDDNAIEKYYYISEGNREKAKKMMLEDGYDVK